MAARQQGIAGAQGSSDAPICPTVWPHKSLRQPAVSRRGMTLVELLVVIAIIATLIALLLPAVQGVREAARLVTCRNHAKQLALACLAHHQSQGFLPSDGWGFDWIGDPDRGFGRHQPGSWNFSVLPFIEQEPLWSQGAGLGGTAKREGFRSLLTTPVPVFHCPSRRPPKLYPQRPGWTYTRHPDGPGYVADVVKCDYGFNRGTVDLPNSFHPGPGSIAQFPTWNPPDRSICTGIAWFGTEYTMAQIRDGSSHTMLLGEKAFNAARGNSWTAGDPQNAYIGHDPDNARLAGPGYPLLSDRHPISTTDDLAAAAIFAIGFGSPHVGGCTMAFCDGSVRTLSWEIQPDMYGRLANRRDGEVIDGSLP